MHIYRPSQLSATANYTKKGQKNVPPADPPFLIALFESILNLLGNPDNYVCFARTETEKWERSGQRTFNNHHIKRK